MEFETVSGQPFIVSAPLSLFLFFVATLSFSLEGLEALPSFFCVGAWCKYLAFLRSDQPTYSVVCASYVRNCGLFVPGPC